MVIELKEGKPPINKNIDPMEARILIQTERGSWYILHWNWWDRVY